MPEAGLWLTGNIAVVVGCCLYVRAARLPTGALVDGFLMAFGVSSLIVATVALAVDVQPQPAWAVMLMSYAVVELCFVASAVAVAAMCRWRPPRPMWWMCAAVVMAALAHLTAAAETAAGINSLGGLVAPVLIVSNTIIACISGSPATGPSRSLESGALEIVAPVAIGIAAIVLVLGTTTRVLPAALGLALVTIVVAKFRLMIAAHTFRRAVRQARLAHMDELTGLRNRRALSTAARMLADSDRTALLLLDLDRFKDVNDSLGHAAGDGVLRIVAQRLTDMTRQSDLVVRLGGDEFAILCPGTDDARAAHLADRIIHDIAEPIAINGQIIHIGVSIGIALAPDQGQDLDTILHHADTAMYTAKTSQRMLQ